MIYILVALFSLGLDQLSKLYIISHIQPHKAITAINGILYITNTRNTGGAFGIFARSPIFFTVISSVLVLLGLVFFFKIKKMPPILQISLGTLLGGTAGNLIDRIRLGAVVDFIDFKFWPTFNVADISICVGVGLLSIYLWKGSIEEKLPQNTEEKGQENIDDGQFSSETNNNISDVIV